MNDQVCRFGFPPDSVEADGPATVGPLSWWMQVVDGDGSRWAASMTSPAPGGAETVPTAAYGVQALGRIAVNS